MGDKLTLQETGFLRQTLSRFSVQDNRASMVVCKAALFCCLLALGSVCAAPAVDAELPPQIWPNNAKAVPADGA